MEWSRSRPNSKSRTAGTTHYKAPELLTTKGKPTPPLLIRPVTARPRIREIPPEPPHETDSSTLDPVTTKYISNLQGQIHLLELESKILKERLAAGEEDQQNALKLDEVDSSEVNPTLQELRRQYAKLEEKTKDEKEVCELSHYHVF